MKNTNTEEMLDIAAAADSDKATDEKGAMAIAPQSENLFQLLCKIFGIEGETPDELIASARQKSRRALIEGRANAGRCERAYNEALAQAKALEEEQEDFKLEEELKDPAFKALLKAGFSVRRAYELAHYEENLERSLLKGQQAGYEKAIEQLKMGMLRPEENGSREQSGISERKNVDALSGKGIRSILSRVEKGAKIKF